MPKRNGSCNNFLDKSRLISVGDNETRRLVNRWVYRALSLLLLLLLPNQAEKTLAAALRNLLLSNLQND